MKTATYSTLAQAKKDVAKKVKWLDDYSVVIDIFEDEDEEFNVSLDIHINGLYEDGFCLETYDNAADAMKRAKAILKGMPEATITRTTV